MSWHAIIFIGRKIVVKKLIVRELIDIIVIAAPLSLLLSSYLLSNFVFAS